MSETTQRDMGKQVDVFADSAPRGAKAKQDTTKNPFERKPPIEGVFMIKWGMEDPKTFATYRELERGGETVGYYSLRCVGEIQSEGEFKGQTVVANVSTLMIRGVSKAAYVAAKLGATFDTNKEYDDVEVARKLGNRLKKMPILKCELEWLLREANGRNEKFRGRDNFPKDGNGKPMYAVSMTGMDGQPMIGYAITDVAGWGVEGKKTQVAVVSDDDEDTPAKGTGIVKAGKGKKASDDDDEEGESGRDDKYAKMMSDDGDGD